MTIQNIVVYLHSKLKVMRQKWDFDSGNARVILEDDCRAVFYCDTLSCPDSVIERVVEIHNTSEQRGFDLLGSSGEIDQYLMDEGDCTQEDREYITEEIYNFFQKDLII